MKELIEKAISKINSITVFGDSPVHTEKIKPFKFEQTEKGIRLIQDFGDKQKTLIAEGPIDACYIWLMHTLIIETFENLPLFDKK